MLNIIKNNILLMSVLLMTLFTILMNEEVMKVEWGFSFSSIKNFSMELMIDYYSTVFSMSVLIISLMVFMYSSNYMFFNKKKNNFFMLVFLFVMSMIILIFSSNLLMIIFGWDLLGFSSFMLIIFYQNKKSYEAGMITIIINRIGDILIFFSIILSTMELNFTIMGLSQMTSYQLSVMIMLLTAGMTKSAQFPFSSWLPAAMAAPTPVSALVHSSTLVTAGVFLLFRISNFFDLNIQEFIFMMGLMTNLMAGMSAMSELDLKKIIALSTLSHLGLMFMGICIFPNSAFFHLISHAFFKSLLFLVVGNVIHLSLDYQDLRKINYMTYLSPMTFCVMLISCMSMCGLPFMSGFFSKDFIIEMLLMEKFNIIYFVLFMMSLSFTIMYSMRLFLDVFYTKTLMTTINKSSTNIFYSMLFLVMLSINGASLLFFVTEKNFFLWSPMDYKMMVYFFMLSGMVLFLILSKSMYKLVIFNWFIGSMFSLYFFSSFILKKSISIFSFTNTSEKNLLGMIPWHLSTNILSDYNTPKPFFTITKVLFAFVMFIYMV